MNVKKSSVKLFPSSKAVINQFLHLPDPKRLHNIIDRVMDFSEMQVDSILYWTVQNFSSRHRNFEKTLLNNFHKVCACTDRDLSSCSMSRRKVIGAYFTKEYSIQAAALFNPSIVPHPDQYGLKSGEQRFVISLRATGEGHISSIIFKSGVIDKKLNIKLTKDTGFTSLIEKNIDAEYTLSFVEERTGLFPGFCSNLLDELPEKFTASTALKIVNGKFGNDPDAKGSIKILEEIFDSNYELKPSLKFPFNEKVIFPNSKSECMGMEDVRFVKFIDGNTSCYYGSYTAYDGKNIRTQLIRTKDFNVFTIRTLYGSAVSDKGMALFPEKVNGKYVMISRQGGEKVNIMFSHNLYYWNSFALLLEPKYPWELVQLGNCGSPIKTEKGWLLLTHGVGPVRTYVISAVLLDLEDPGKVIGRLDKPILFADHIEREGYVPNVVYTCGMLVHGHHVLIPYAVSDAATGFATVSIKEILENF